MAIKAIVIDFGNVVGFFDHRLTSNRLAAFSRLPADVIHTYLFGGRLEADYDSGRITTPEFLEQVCETCRLDCTEDIVSKAWAEIFRPNPDVCDFLPRLKPDYRLLLASNTNELHSRQFCRQFADTLQYFDAVVLSHEVGVRKPGALFFEYCLRLARYAPRECLLIDDLPANVAGAQACGWQGIVYDGITDLRERLASFGILKAK